MLTNIVNLEKVGFVMPSAGARQAEVVEEVESVEAFTEAEAQEHFEQTAQRYLKMSSHQFLEMWDANAFSPEQEADVYQVAVLIPLVRHISAGKKTR